MQKSDNIFSNHILITAEAEEVKKGGKKKGSVAKVIALIAVMEDLQTKVEECLDSQEDEEIRSKIEAFDKHIDEMLQALTDITTSSIQSLRKRTRDDDQDAALEEGKMASGASGRSSESVKSLSPAMVVSPHLPVRP